MRRSTIGFLLAGAVTIAAVTVVLVVRPSDSLPPAPDRTPPAVSPEQDPSSPVPTNFGLDRTLPLGTVAPDAFDEGVP
ncbi:MAG: hypothetical protein LC808_38645, partial [Actinobacteria bacterium]|nr:hypothetical protein [Actinomycetota bacterium]